MSGGIDKLRNKNTVSTVNLDDYFYIAKNQENQGDGKIKIEDLSQIFATIEYVNNLISGTNIQISLDAYQRYNVVAGSTTWTFNSATGSIPTSYINGQILRITAPNNNTGALMGKIGSLPAKKILKGDTLQDVSENDILQNYEYELVYIAGDDNGSGAFRLLNISNIDVALKSNSLDQFVNGTDGSNTIHTSGRDFLINNKRAMAGYSTAEGNILYINFANDFGNGCMIGKQLAESISLNGNGYIKLQSGLILQWGFGNYNRNFQFETYNFPIAFPNTCLFVNVGTQMSGGGNAEDIWYQLSSYSSTQFTCIQQSSGTTGIASLRVTFIAIGY